MKKNYKLDFGFRFEDDPKSKFKINDTIKKTMDKNKIISIQICLSDMCMPNLKKNQDLIFSIIKLNKNYSYLPVTQPISSCQSLLAHFHPGL